MHLDDSCLRFLHKFMHPDKVVNAAQEKTQKIPQKTYWVSSKIHVKILRLMLTCLQGAFFYVFPGNLSEHCELCGTGAKWV